MNHRSDGMVDTFGVLDHDGNEKPAYRSFHGWVHNHTATADL